MFERPKHNENALIVHIDLVGKNQEESITEFKELVSSAGFNETDSFEFHSLNPEPKYLIGESKAKLILEKLKNNPAALVVFSQVLSPSQERNLEQLLKCRVLDRTGLILEIFARRAQSFEGKLQVELAQLQHHATRLVRGWTHLERQKGSVNLRGPGETQLEVDRRQIRNRIKFINSRLVKVKSRRAQGKNLRRRNLIPTVSLVGYTNAGKSTLFNVLTQAQVRVANQLFATLDPTLRQIHLPGAGDVILADTVGFIRDLPHHLIEAFSATLEETREASLLLHVIDTNDPMREEKIASVNSVLEKIKVDHIPQLLVYNKIDVNDAIKPSIERDFYGKPKAVKVSATKQLGLDLLQQVIFELLFGDPIIRTIVLELNQAKLRAELYKLNAVTHESTDTEGRMILTLKIAKRDYERLFPIEDIDREDRKKFVS